MKIDDGSNDPGVGIGNIKLDITREQLLNIIGSDFKERFRENDSVIEVENARFWIAEDNCLDQIGVQKGFTGKNQNKKREYVLNQKMLMIGMN